eukprot:Phypoly_transcript_02764.p1 GENE.Phypoly_transcript_02764~~Phypoly_transcript_02764.p1  ORF type:complete len:717 (+),score=93.20 Phypoly_transcript_02764:210-2360(+)
MSSSSSSVESNESYGAFATVLVTNTLIALGIFVAFGILRSFRQNRYFFAPQYYEQQGTTDPLPDPGTGLFAWIRPTVRFDDRDMFHMRGLDSLMYVKFVKYMAILFLLFAPIGLAVLIPLDATGDFNKTGLPSITMANLSKHSGRIWVHALYAVFCTFLTYYFLYRLYEMYARWRVQYLKMEVARNYTVMYKGIPRELLSQYSPMEIFQRYFPGEVVDAQVGLKAGRLRKLVKKYEKNEKKLQFAQAAVAEHGQHYTKRTKPIIGHKMDAIEFYQQKLAQLGAQIEAERSTAGHLHQSQVGFVTFRTIAQASQRSQLVMDLKADVMKPTHAPDPSEVYWKQLEISKKWRLLMTPVVWGICAALIIFWGTITVFIQGIANLKNLAKTDGFHWLNKVVNWNPVAYGLIAGFLPALALIILFALLPKFLEAMVKLKGVYTQSQVQRSVLKYYFWFLVVNVFIVTLVAGGALQIIHLDGFSALSTLGQALPTQSSFFINYILTYALASYPMNILRIGPFIISKLKKRKARSTAEIKDIEKPKPFNYELVCGIQLIIFVIGIAYTPIAPFIIPWTIFFFGFSYFYGKYLLMYVHSPEYDSGALFWPVIFNRCIIGMILAQIMLIGLFIFKAHPSLVFVVPLPFLTLAFVYLVHKRFDESSNHLPINEYPLDSPNNGQIYAGMYQDPFTVLDTSASQSNLLSYNKNDKPLAAPLPPTGPGAV